MTLWRNRSGERLGWKLRSSTVETSTLTGEGVGQSLGPEIWKAVLLSRDIVNTVFSPQPSRTRWRARCGKPINQTWQMI